jgi:hypothetical protein
MILSGSKGPNFDFSHQASPPIIEGPSAGARSQIALTIQMLYGGGSYLKF